ncbi:hypothetical protein GGR53DRAFT_130017 [Hypoxylon sp. FL1150]|nr:hypothetical protein GGR53DRAFT_130017 [Hypoxylon sp. FL1150]
MSSDPYGGLYRSTDELVSEHAFKIVLWIGVGLCVTFLALRLCIRLLCFRTLLWEDSLMILALAILISVAALLQRFVGDIYLVLHVENQLLLPGPDFPDRMISGLRADGIAITLFTIGIWSIKLNFMLFFRQFGRQIRNYMILWWVALVLVISCGAIQLGVIPYDCTFGSLFKITVQCATEASVSHIYTVYKVTVAVDTISDAIIICFPVLIVWGTKINLRQKLVLTAVFLLVGFTIAVTIIRGSVFGGVYKDVESVDRKVLDMAWLLFWYLIQYIVSFTIACIVSFRSLWAKRERRLKDEKIELERQHRIQAANRNHTKGNTGLLARWQRLHDSLLNTLADIEGVDPIRDTSMLIQLEPPSGRLTVDFSKWNDASDSTLKSGLVTSTHNEGSHSSPTRSNLSG